MKNLLRSFLFIILILPGSLALGQNLSRTVVEAAGETFTNNNLSLTYILGEAVGDLLISPGADKFLTVGFAQPDIELQQILSMDITKSFVVYPNPVSGNTVKLAFNNLPDGFYNVSIIDAAGKTLQTQIVNYSSSTFFYLPLDISQYKGGVYFIKVTTPINLQGQVKLIKI